MHLVAPRVWEHWRVRLLKESPGEKIKGQGVSQGKELPAERASLYPQRGWNVFWEFCQSAGTAAQSFQRIRDCQHRWSDQEEVWEPGNSLEDSTLIR